MISLLSICSLTIFLHHSLRLSTWEALVLWPGVATSLNPALLYNCRYTYCTYMYIRTVRTHACHTSNRSPGVGRAIHACQLGAVIQQIRTRAFLRMESTPGIDARRLFTSSSRTRLTNDIHTIDNRSWRMIRCKNYFARIFPRSEIFNVKFPIVWCN